MATNSPIITTHDPRTGRTYAIQGGGDAKVSQEKLAAQMERDYQKTLPPERRDVANQSTDFCCPFCKTDTLPTSRKVPLKSGFFLGWSTRLEDVFNCKDCSREFTGDQLYLAQKEIRDSNYRAVLMEKYKDGEITESVLKSALKF